MLSKSLILSVSLKLAHDHYVFSSILLSSAFKKGPARMGISGRFKFFWGGILLILVSKQFASFSHVNIKFCVCSNLKDNCVK
jgi:hypothetical protein